MVPLKEATDAQGLFSVIVPEIALPLCDICPDPETLIPYGVEWLLNDQLPAMFTVAALGVESVLGAKATAGWVKNADPLVLSLLLTFMLRDNSEHKEPSKSLGRIRHG